MCDACQKFAKNTLKNTKILVKISLGIDTLFPTMSDQPTHQFAIVSPFQCSGIALYLNLPAAH